MWYIVSLDEQNYVCLKDGQSKYHISSNIQNAIQFEKQSDASKYLQNCMPKSVRSAYKVVRIRDRESVSDKPIKVSEKCSLQDSDTLSDIRKFVSIANKHKRHYKATLESLDIVENKLVDMYHYIALKDLGVVAGFKVYKELQALLRERRRLKDEKLLCEGFIDDMNKGDFSLEQFFRNTDRLKNAKYTPRALPGLFDNDDN